MPHGSELTDEMLEEWRSHPVTQRLLAILRKGAAHNRKSLEAQLWQEGQCNPEHLGRCKAQAELIEDLTEGTPDEWNQWADEFERD